MITGTVTAYREAIISLLVEGSTGQEREIQAVIDTGFDGHLTLPLSLVEILGLPWRRRGRAVLAAGSESVFDIYEATVLWDGRPRRVIVDQTDRAPLVGMALLEDCELTIQVVDGGTVTITQLPP
jgi:clan AA aspartic protease